MVEWWNMTQDESMGGDIKVEAKLPILDSAIVGYLEKERGSLLA